MSHCADLTLLCPYQVSIHGNGNGTGTSSPPKRRGRPRRAPPRDGSSYFPISQSMVRSMAREQTGQNRSMFRVNMMQSVVGR